MKNLYALENPANAMMMAMILAMDPDRGALELARLNREQDCSAEKHRLNVTRDSLKKYQEFVKQERKERIKEWCFNGLMIVGLSLTVFLVAMVLM